MIKLTSLLFQTKPDLQLLICKRPTTGKTDQAQVDLRDVVQTDVGPYHIVLAVLVYMYADSVHKQGQAVFQAPLQVSLILARDTHLFTPSLRSINSHLPNELTDRSWCV